MPISTQYGTLVQKNGLLTMYIATETPYTYHTMCRCLVSNVVAEPRYRTLSIWHATSNLILRTAQATQRARARWEEGQKVAMEKAAAQAVEDKEKALEDTRRVRQSCFYPAVAVSRYCSYNLYQGVSTYTVCLKISTPHGERKPSY